jgi:D-alanine-D-alanine ligase
MSKKNVLVLFGGGGTEHEISQVSVKHINDVLNDDPDFQLVLVEILKDGSWGNNKNEKFSLDWEKNLINHTRREKIPIDIVIPCIHGYPGETGDLQSFFDLISLPYLGCNAESSKIAFNKVTCKLWAEKIGVPTTPSVFLIDQSTSQLNIASEFLKIHGEVVVKASNQGSSVGCYLVSTNEDLVEKIGLAFKLSPFVLIEKRLKPREIELSVYQWNNEIYASDPGEIVCPSQFYSYEEKYSKDSKTYTLVKAPDLSEKQIELLKYYALKVFKGLKLRHLSRIDFFLDQGEIWFNEVNSFPGLTPISMFPKMMEANGHPFGQYLRQILHTL